MLLNVNNLNILYKDFLYVEDLNFFIKKGEIFSIVGESGSGKTITGLSIVKLLPDYFKIEGKIFFEDRDISKLSEREFTKIRGKKISFIFQDPMASLNPVIKIGFQVAEMLIHHYNVSKKEALEKTAEIFKKFKLHHVINSYPHELSGGMRQRVMIAMAIACEPEFIIADEPTTALDVTIQEEILDLLYCLVKEEGKALLLITHDINILGEYADRVMVMYAGRIMEMGSVEEIFRKPLHPYTKALLNCIPTEDKKVTGIPGQIPELKKLPTGCVFHPRCEYKKEPCMTENPLLKEVSPFHWVRCFK